MAYTRPKLPPSNSTPAVLPSSAAAATGQSTTWSRPTAPGRAKTSHFADDSEEELLQPISSSSTHLPLARPVLTSKFSNDNLTPVAKRMVTKAWLQSITSAARNSTASASSSPTTSAAHPDPRPMVISNPGLVHNGGAVMNERLGSGARRVGKPSEAFRPHVYVPPSSPPAPRRSEDSVRSYTSNSSFQSAASTSFSFNRPDRALPLLPLRIDSLADNAAVEHLAHTPIPHLPGSNSFRQRSQSSNTEDSIPFGHSAISRPATPEVPKVPRSILKNRSLMPASAPKEDERPKLVAEAPRPSKPVPEFRAILARPVPRLPSYIRDEEKLVTLRVGDKVLTTTLSVLNSQPSCLKDFVQSSVEASTSSKIVSTLHSPIISSRSPLSSSKSSYSLPSPQRPHMVSPRLPSQVILNFPSSPITAIRSARASIFDDVPSDEGEFDDELIKSPLNPSSPGHLAVPQRNGANRLSGSSYSSDNALMSFLDTTPDEEADNPFHFSEQKRQANEPEPESSSSQPPSLSSSPNSSAFHIGSPVSVSAVTAQLSASRPFDSLIAQQQGSATDRAIEVYLDRPAEPYEVVFHYLREAELPRKLKYSTSAALLAGSPTNTSDTSSQLQDMVKDIPLSLRPTLLPFLLHPVVSQLEDTRDEAIFLGMPGLEELCQKELQLLQSLSKARNVAPLNEQRRGRTGSPVRRLREESGKERPRLGHRQYHSEASVVKSIKVDDDGWI